MGNSLFKSKSKRTDRLPNPKTSFITESKHAIVFNNDGEGFELQAMEDSLILIGTGAPLNEKVVSHGPFVMNSSTEIMQAFKDYQLGKMGVLIEE